MWLVNFQKHIEQSQRSLPSQKQRDLHERQFQTTSPTSEFDQSWYYWQQPIRIEWSLSTSFQHAEARLFQERYEERFGPLHHSARPSSTPLAKESRLLSKSSRRLDIKPASHFTEQRSYESVSPPQFATPKVPGSILFLFSLKKQPSLSFFCI